MRGKGQGVCPSNGDAMFETVGTWQLYFDGVLGLICILPLPRTLE